MNAYESPKTIGMKQEVGRRSHMGDLGFSYVGFVFLRMLAIPNLIGTKHQSNEYNYQNEHKLLLVLKRVG